MQVSLSRCRHFWDAASYGLKFYLGENTIEAWSKFLFSPWKLFWAYMYMQLYHYTTYLLASPPTPINKQTRYNYWTVNTNYASYFYCLKPVIKVIDQIPKIFLTIFINLFYFDHKSSTKWSAIHAPHRISLINVKCQTMNE